MDFIRFNPTDKQYAIALGNFDGIHFGHQQVIKTAIQKAKEIGCTSAVVTFMPHPSKVIIGNNFQEILSFDEKILTIKNLGVDEVIVINFTELFSQMPAESFINELCQKLNIRSITTGYNFRFGHNRHGSVNTIDHLKHKYYFKFNVINQILYNSLQVSSSILRQIIKIGCMKVFSNFTDRYYSIECNLQYVIHDILVYTISNSYLLLPPIGIYLGLIEDCYCCIFLNNINIKVKFLNKEVKLLNIQIKLLTILGQEKCLDIAVMNNDLVSAYTNKAKFYLNLS